MQNTSVVVCENRKHERAGATSKIEGWCEWDGEGGGYQLQQLPNNNRAPAISGSRLHQAVSRARWSGRIPWWVIESSGARQSSSLCPIISGDSGNFRKQNSDSDNGTDLNKSYKSSFIIQKKTENIILFLLKYKKKEKFALSINTFLQIQ